MFTTQQMRFQNIQKYCPILKQKGKPYFINMAPVAN